MRRWILTVLVLVFASTATAQDWNEALRWYRLGQSVREQREYRAYLAELQRLENELGRLEVEAAETERLYGTYLARAIAPAIRAYDPVGYGVLNDNSYIISRGYGNTRLYGLNARTGSIWNETVIRDGSSYGFDATGNYFNYNARTGLYWNTNGTMCFGTGHLRTCY